jgi:hypothetical protein
MIRVENLKRKRLVYSLSELELIINWNRPTILIGDGESKTNFIFWRRHCNIFCINRSILDYPGDIMVTSKTHFTEYLNRLIPPFIPVCLITGSDGKEYKLSRGANAVVFLQFVIKMTNHKRIWLQGFDFSRSDQPGYNWRNQAAGFRKCQEMARKKGVILLMTHYNPLLNFIQVARPPDDLIL